MSRAINETSIQGRWIHSDEEGDADQLVLRPEEYLFTPRRMPRHCLTIKPNGVAELGLPGPADRNVLALEKWSLDDNELSISGSSQLSGIFRITAVDEQMLVLQRKHKEGK